MDLIKDILNCMSVYKLVNNRNLMIIKEYQTKIYSPIPIIDIEIGNQIKTGTFWDYGKSDIITFGILYEDKIIILQREKKDNVEDFKEKIKSLLSNLPQVTPYCFNQKMEFFGVNGFLKTESKYPFSEIMTFRGKGWNKDRFFEEVKQLIKIEDTIDDKLNGDSSLVMQKYKEEKYEDIISHNHSCLIKEAYILINNPKLWKKFKSKVDKDGWFN
jgi:hypothetical protein